MNNLAFCSNNQSGEDRIKSPRFLQALASHAFKAKPFGWLQLAMRWLQTVNYGCHRLLGVVFSTVSAQSEQMLAVGKSVSLPAKKFGPVATVGQRHRVRAGNAFRKIDRQIRVVIYARYSTEEQDASSIDDQFAFCKQYLESIGLGDAAISFYSDAEVSGEVRNRPGIDQLWQGIEKRAWDLILVEDASRLFRNDTMGLEFVEGAYDKGIRTISINDLIDTAEAGFGDRLRDVLRHHAKSNYFTRVRIRRRHEQLWMMGAAVCGRRPGYNRTPTVAASIGEPARGPHYDTVDEAAAAVVQEIYQRIADGQEAWMVAEFANQQKLPKCTNSQGVPWTPKDINALIRRTIYKGQDTHCETLTEKAKRTGKKQVTRNEVEDIWYREMPDLRIVSDELWERANQAIDKRALRKSYKSGFDHPLKGIPRDSRGPLSQIFVCGICGAKMYMFGRVDGGYCCSGAKKKECWNHATALRALTHAQIGKAVAECLIPDEASLEVLVETIQRSYDKHLKDQDYVHSREHKIKAAEAKQGRMIAFIQENENVSRAVNDQLLEIEKELQSLQFELDQHRQRQASTEHCISREEIVAKLEKAKSTLLNMGPEMAHLLKVLIPNKIKAQPYEQMDAEKDQLLDNHKAVLRAEFEVHLIQLLPQELTSLLQSSELDIVKASQAVRLYVDLFEPSLVPKLAQDILKHRYPDDGKKRSYDELAELLGVSNQSAFRATKLAKMMKAEGLTEPYKRLTECPEKMSRWILERRTS